MALANKKTARRRSLCSADRGGGSGYAQTDALYWLISLLKAEAFSRSKSYSPVAARVRRCSAISSADVDLRFKNLGSVKTSPRARLKIPNVTASYC